MEHSIFKKFRSGLLLIINFIFLSQPEIHEVCGFVCMESVSFPAALQSFQLAHMSHSGYLTWYYANSNYFCSCNAPSMLSILLRPARRTRPWHIRGTVCYTASSVAQYFLPFATSPVDPPCSPFCFVIQCGSVVEAKEVLLLRPLVLELQTTGSAAQQIESLSCLLPRLMETL